MAAVRTYHQLRHQQNAPTIQKVTERDRETERQTDRQTDRETDRETDRQRETERERQRERDRGRERGTERETETKRERQTERDRQREREQNVDEEAALAAYLWVFVFDCLLDRSSNPHDAESNKRLLEDVLEELALHGKANPRLPCLLFLCCLVTGVSSSLSHWSCLSLPLSLCLPLSVSVSLSISLCLPLSLYLLLLFIRGCCFPVRS